MKLAIGVTGSPLAGKETAANAIAEYLQKDGFSVSRHRFSDVLRDTLDLWGLPHGRTNEQLMAQLMILPQFYGPNTLSNAMKMRLMKDPVDVGIVDGVRWFSDEEMFRAFPDEGIKSLIIYVAADEDVRYERLRKRNRAGESVTTREEFARQNQQPNEIYIAEIGSRADIKLTNNYDAPAPFLKNIRAAYEKQVRPLL